MSVCSLHQTIPRRISPTNRDETSQFDIGNQVECRNCCEISRQTQQQNSRTISEVFPICESPIIATAHAHAVVRLYGIDQRSLQIFGVCDRFNNVGRKIDRDKTTGQRKQSVWAIFPTTSHKIDRKHDISLSSIVGFVRTFNYYAAFLVVGLLGTRRWSSEFVWRWCALAARWGVVALGARRWRTRFAAVVVLRRLRSLIGQLLVLLIGLLLRQLLVWIVVVLLCRFHSRCGNVGIAHFSNL